MSNQRVLLVFWLGNQLLNMGNIGKPCSYWESIDWYPNDPSLEDFTGNHMVKTGVSEAPGCPSILTGGASKSENELQGFRALMMSKIGKGI